MDPALDRLPCGLLSFADDGRIVAINAPLCAMLGHERDELLAGRHVQTLLSAGGRVFYQTHLFPLLKLQGEVEEIYLSLRSKDGEEVPFLLNGRRRENGGRFESECVLVRMRQRGHFETELLNAKKAAQKASRAKDEFMAALSHELRTPLTPVLMVATVMEMDPALPEEARAQAAVIRRNAELEARLIDDLLDHTRIANGKLSLVPAPVDLHALLSHTAEIVKSEGTGKRVGIRFEKEAADHHVEGDAARLQQVFWNVIKNAVKFTASGGEVVVTTSNDPEGLLVVKVVDTGIGIAPEALPHIFNAFEQGGVSTRTFGGLGLGLAISRAIVNLHQGTIRAESEGPGRGATFSVALKTLRVPAPAEAPAAPAPIAGPPAGLRLLLVEDHDSTRDVLARILRRAGHEVLVAGTGAEAIALAGAAGNFDAMISDLGLPDQSGLDLIQAIRALRPGIPAIAMSGYGFEEDLRRAKAAGFTDYLVKPVSFNHLRALLDGVVARDRREAVAEQ